MSLSKEAEHQELTRSTDLEKDFDIHTLTDVGIIVDEIPGSNFVVTGSYAVEALTGVPLSHNDMDSNVFTKNMWRDLPQIATQLGEQENFVLFTRTVDRLEYDVRNKSDLVTPRRLEIQFVEIADVIREDSFKFVLRGSKHSVPTVKAPLIDSTGQESFLLVKSLPYQIATWAIRISGVAENPKREVRDTDLDHLRLLLTGDFTQEDIISIMNRHPQMPKDGDPNKTLTAALNLLK